MSQNVLLWTENQSTTDQLIIIKSIVQQNNKQKAQSSKDLWETLPLSKKKKKGSLFSGLSLDINPAHPCEKKATLGAKVLA